MSNRAAIAAMQAAIYGQFGEPVAWAGQDGLQALVTVLRADPEQVVGFGGSSAIIASNQFRVRCSEVLKAATNDTFVGAPDSSFPNQIFRVVDQPRRSDRLQTEWSFQASPVAP